MEIWQIPMTKAYDIVGYTFNADTYCDGVCVLVALGAVDKATADAATYITDVTTRFDGAGTVEGALDVIAAQRGINREREDSFDSGNFPKVVFSSGVEGPEACGGCRGYLDGVDINDYEPCEHNGWKHKDASECLC